MAPNDIRLLHNAARHYCRERIAYWHKRYAELQAAGRDRDREVTRPNAWDYSAEAYGMFPRYNVLEAILGDIEHYVPDDFESIEKLREILLIAGETAENPLNKGNSNPAKRAAISEERGFFVQYARSVDIASVGKLPMLPFRRALGAAELARWHKDFRQRWGEWYGGYEGRIIDGVHVTKRPALPTVTLHEKAMAHDGAYDQLRAAILRQGISRLLELCEGGDGYEIDLEEATFFYSKRGESFWTTPNLSWMVYASHESSITFGGAWLISAMRAVLPEFQRYLYKSWALEDYPPVP